MTTNTNDTTLVTEGQEYCIEHLNGLILFAGIADSDTEALARLENYRRYFCEFLGGGTKDDLTIRCIL